jgi:flagellar basal body-associated protein FliL
MKKKWILIAIAVVVLGGAYAVYALFFLERVPVGAVCKGSAQCEGQCLGFGDLLPDYSHQEICTKPCTSNADCPSTTRCEEVNLITSDGKGTQTQAKSYCLPPTPATQ